MPLDNLRFYIRNILGKYPIIFYPIYNIRSRNRKVSVNHSTQLVIEGFPRSANTFTVCAFQYAQNTEINIARHLHVPSQVFRAVRLRIPTLVLIRSPREAVASLLVRSPAISATQALRAYASFYRTILPYKKGYLVATFETAISNIDKITLALNARFHTEFIIPRLNDQDIQKVFKIIDEMNRQADRSLETHVARPSIKRKVAKKEVLVRVIKSPFLSVAEEVYSDFLIETRSCSVCNWFTGPNY